MLAMVLVACGVALHDSAVFARPPGRPLPTADEVREAAATLSKVAVDRVPFDTRAANELLSRKGDAFPAYRVILSDPKSTELELSGVLRLIRLVDAPKAQFLPLATPHLCHENWWVRFNAVVLIQQIGTPEECGVLMALLSDESNLVRNRAAEALADVGGAAELRALDAWVCAAPSLGKDEAFVKRVRACRDRLEGRLRDGANGAARLMASECGRGRTLTG